MVLDTLQQTAGRGGQGSNLLQLFSAMPAVRPPSSTPAPPWEGLSGSVAPSELGGHRLEPGLGSPAHRERAQPRGHFQLTAYLGQIKPLPWTLTLP